MSIFKYLKRVGEGMATHSSILAWEPIHRGAWWPTVHGVRACHNKEVGNGLATEQQSKVSLMLARLSALILLLN